MLFVAHPILEPDPKLGLPTYLERTFTEVFNEKKPLYSPVPRPWWDYNVYKDGVPPTGDKRLPAKLLMICKNTRKFNPDFFSDQARNWTISKRFRAFLKSRHLLDGEYEESELTVLSTTQKPLADQPYYLWRLFQFSNALLDLEQSTKLISPVKPFTEYTPPYVYYTDLVFKPDVQVPPLFYFNDRSYFYSFFCSEEIKQAIEAENFLGFNFYTLEEYAQMRIEWERRQNS